MTPVVDFVNIQLRFSSFAFDYFDNFQSGVSFLLTDLAKVTDFGEMIILPLDSKSANVPECAPNLLKRFVSNSSKNFQPMKSSKSIPKSVPSSVQPGSRKVNSLGQPNATPGSVGSVKFGEDGLGNLVCPLCQKKFSNTGNANRHFQAAHGNILFKCHMCDYNSNRKDALKAHGIKKHGLSEEMVRAMIRN